MKKLLLLLLILPLLSFAQKKCHRTFNIAKNDSLKVVVVTTPSEDNKFLADSALRKAIIQKLSKKEEKSGWDMLTILAAIIIPLLAGLFGYYYIRTQAIANARLEWIKNFRPLIAKLLTDTLRAQLAHEEYSDAGKERDDIEENKNALQESLQTYIDISKSKNSNTQDQKTAIFFIDQIKQGLVLADEKLQFANVKYASKETQYKEAFFSYDQALHETYASLDPNRYGSTHQELLKKLDDLRDCKPDNVDFEKFQGLIKKIRTLIQSVIAEQWNLAEGESFTEFIKNLFKAKGNKSDTKNYLSEKDYEGK